MGLYHVFQTYYQRNQDTKAYKPVKISKTQDELREFNLKLSFTVESTPDQLIGQLTDKNCLKEWRMQLTSSKINPDGSQVTSLKNGAYTETSKMYYFSFKESQRDADQVVFIEQIKDNFNHNFHRFWFMQQVKNRSLDAMRVSIYTIVSPNSHIH
jgi:hypothetical protein